MSITATSGSFVEEWAKAQKLRAPTLTADPSSSIFQRNLEAELDANRSQHLCAMFHVASLPVDFSSCDVVSLGSSGLVKKAFLQELSDNPDFVLGSQGTRPLNGNSAYLETVEREIAEFHGAETALIVVSGAVANDAIFAVVRPGDAIVYDELVHASTHYGMKNSLALIQKPFKHNSVSAFIDTLNAVREESVLIREGKRSVIIAVESFYSMDGDICPLKELVAAAKRIFPGGNAQFVVDEAHSTGNIGPKGAGLVNLLGLEKEIAIRNHTFGKSLSGVGAAILCSHSVRSMLINQAKPILFSTAPSFPIIAPTRAAYKMLKAGATVKPQEKVQHLIKLFMEEMTENPIWDKANDSGFLRIPLYEEDDWESVPFVSQICPVWTKAKHNLYLAVHLQLAGFNVYPISFPVVPKGTDRIRLVFHAHNTDDDVRRLAKEICGWAKETMECEVQNRMQNLTGEKVKMCKAARHAVGLVQAA
ncbi:class II aminotransferase/8-amino-7-oxononanoate synthase [Podospora australis]|uniref:Class II aminotransferase/8-amino-7-oxononanoate synthase n=1 Tax=Podospora australis TaxID=1536484 RepID=A0AAN6WMV3_9PEZI|nr:class II aminotransferase/8-amino-7-oxononanoate synthase [Podospora australis]